MAKYGAADLVMTAGETFTKTFTREVNDIAQPWTGRTTRLQMKTVWTNELLIELTAFLYVDADPTKLVLSIPGEFTAKLFKEGVWDLLSTVGGADAFRLPQPYGRILVLQGVTASV